MTLEGVIGKGINREADTLTFLHTTDISLIDICNHTHVRQVLGNHKELRGVERGSHRLAFLHALRENYTVDGRSDGGIAKVRPGLAHTLTGGIHLFLGLLIRQLGALILIGTHQTLLVECLVTVVVRELIVGGALGTCEISLLRIQLTDQVRTVQLGNHLTFLHHRVVVHIEVAHDTRHLCTNGHRGNRFDGTRCRDARLDLAILNLGHLKRHFLFFLPTTQEEPCNQDDADHTDCDPTFLSNLFHISLFSLLFKQDIYFISPPR